MTADDTRARLTVRIPQALQDRLDLLADVTERSVNDLVTEALEDYVLNHRALVGFPPVQEALDAFLDRYAEEKRKYDAQERPARVRRRRWKEDDQD